jgi:regulator of CtrA degradation
MPVAEPVDLGWWDVREAPDFLDVTPFYRFRGIRDLREMSSERSSMSFLTAEKPVSFGAKLAASDQFGALFRDGMDLVGDAAAYLDGAGREQAQALPRPVALAYAVESMRLTTRLMQIASWLLLQRAVNEGELTRAEASSEKRRIHLSRQDAVSTDELLSALPLRLCELIEMSLRLQARIRHIDALIHRPDGDLGRTRPPSPVDSQISLLRAAFPGC